MILLSASRMRFAFGPGRAVRIFGPDWTAVVVGMGPSPVWLRRNTAQWTDCSDEQRSALNGQES
jgi:hypothetical protein